MNNSSETRTVETILETIIETGRRVSGRFFGHRQEDVLSGSGELERKKNDLLYLGPNLTPKPTNITKNVEEKQSSSEAEKTQILIEEALKQVQAAKLKGQKAAQQMI